MLHRRLIFCGGPSSGGIADGIPSLVPVSEPAIAGAFVAHLAPDALLGIQAWLIGRQVGQMQIGMRGQELIDERTSVPGGAVDIEVDGLAAQALTQAAQQSQKGMRVAFGQAHQAVPPEQRSHPTKNIEPLAVFAARGDVRPLPAASPESAEARMLGKSSFVFKHQNVAGTQTAQFFLTGGGIFRPLPPWPASRRSPRGSDDSRGDAANSELGEPAAILRNAGAGERPGWVHPKRRAATPAALGCAPDQRTPGGVSERSVGWGDRAASFRLPQPLLADSHGAPNGSGSCG